MATTLDKKRTRQTLLAQVRKRIGNLPAQPAPQTDLKEFRQNKIAPVVQGLFPEEDWDALFHSLERSVAYLHADNLEPLLLEAASDQTAGQLAQLYLQSRGVERPLAETIGINDGEKCYLTSDYFWHKSPFADFLVHDCAQLLHERGLVAVARRETFARACEAYARVLELASTQAARLQLVEEMATDPLFGPVADLVGEAVRSDNGWKELVRACS